MSGWDFAWICCAGTGKSAHPTEVVCGTGMVVRGRRKSEAWLTMLVVGQGFSYADSGGELRDFDHVFVVAALVDSLNKDAGQMDIFGWYVAQFDQLFDFDDRGRRRHGH